jgi:hypothetical protein
LKKALKACEELLRTAPDTIALQPLHELLEVQAALGRAVQQLQIYASAAHGHYACHLLLEACESSVCRVAIM